jgi:hypothetical protein
MLTYRATWYQQDVTAFNWPQLNQSTYYWIVISPTTPLSITNQVAIQGPKFQGIIWSGIDSGKTPSSVPPLSRTDPNVFTARVLRSQTGPGDSANACNKAAAINFINGAIATTNTQGWAAYAGSRLGDWQADPAGSRIVYGMQVLGFLVVPSPSSTNTGET